MSMFGNFAPILDGVIFTGFILIQAVILYFGYGYVIELLAKILPKKPIRT